MPEFSGLSKGLRGLSVYPSIAYFAPFLRTGKKMQFYEEKKPPKNTPKK